jgi:hypothetical protein
MHPAKAAKAILNRGFHFFLISSSPLYLGRLGTKAQK